VPDVAPLSQNGGVDIVYVDVASSNAGLLNCNVLTKNNPLDGGRLIVKVIKGNAALAMVLIGTPIGSQVIEDPSSPGAAGHGAGAVSLRSGPGAEAEWIWDSPNQAWHLINVI
jgi:hypothetical protein